MSKHYWFKVSEGKQRLMIDEDALIRAAERAWIYPTGAKRLMEEMGFEVGRPSDGYDEMKKSIEDAAR